MSSEIYQISTEALSIEDAEEMVKPGITRVPVDYFHYGDFRYTNLKEAVAEAKRQQKIKAGMPAGDGG